MKKDYINIQKNAIRIIFPKYVTRIAFETILKQAYPKTLSKTEYDKIVFSFQSVEWVDIFELSLTSLWINKLYNLKKNVSFVCPLNEKAFGFLQEYKFIDSLLGVTIQNRPTNILSYKTSDITYYPLSFLSLDEFSSRLDDLNYKDRYEQVFKEVYDSEIIKTGKLRDIIFTELGENMFVHGDGINTSIAAKAYSHIDKEKVKGRVESVSSFEKDFFRILGNQPYIEIVVNDNGRGIYRKLSTTFKKDKRYPKWSENPTHSDVIEYAFLPYSSSRNLKERLNFIEKELSDDLINNPPVTGLNKVKQIVKEYRGLLLVKSGKGLICYDFLTDGELVFPATNNDKKHNKFKDLISFSGTQYKILIPLRKPLSTKPIQQKFHFQEIKRDIKYTYKRLDNFFTSESKYKVAIAKDQYYKFEQEIEYFHISNHDKNIILIFDFCEAGIVNQKLLHLIITKLLITQTTSQLNSFVNLHSEYIELLESNYEFNKPIVGFDNKFNRRILGVTKEDRVYFNQLLSQRNIETPEFSSFISRFPSLFDLSTKSFIHNRNGILSYASTSIREIIKDIILDPVSNVFHEYVKVLIPTNHYCEGYFEIGNLFKNSFNRSLIKQWLTFGFNILKPNLIISLSEHCGQIISEIKIDYKHNIDSIILETPIKEIDFLKLSLKIDKSSRIIVFTDVISTSNTVKKLLRSLSAFNVIHIVTVANATERTSFNVFGKSVPVSQALHKPIHYYESLPSDWLYSELLLTDSKTNLLIPQDEFRPKGSLLKDFSIISKKENGIEVLKNDFLDKIIIPNNLYEGGHFITNNKHFSFLFNIKELVEKFENLLVDSILKHFQSDSKKRKLKSGLDNYILYFSYNPGVLQLCNSLLKRLPKSKIIDIDLGKIKNPIINDIQNENVIIIDDAFISGTSIMNLIDYCEKRGAKNIFVYILIKRGTILSARKLENTKKYGHSSVSVRYLFDSELPNYGIYNCPICSEMNSIERIKSFMGKVNTKFWNYITSTHENKNKRLVNSDFVFTNIANNNYNILYRWKIETSKYDLISQKEIIHYLINYNAHFESVKELYSIYSFEKENLLFKEIYSTENYWNELRYTLLNTGIEILKNKSSSEIKLSNNIIDVIFWLDIETINNLFPSILNHAFSDENRMFELLYIVNKNRDRCIQSLNTFSSLIKNKLEISQSFDDEVKNTIETFINSWSRKFSEASLFSDKQKEAIRTLFFESYHEFPRTYDALISCLNYGEDRNEILSHWWSLKEIVQKSIKNLKLLLETGISSKHIEVLNARVLEMSDLAFKIDNFINSKADSDILKILDRLFNLIVGTDGIQSLLKSCRVDLKKSIRFLNDKYSKQFDEKGIKVFYNTRDFPCLVFGESSNILTSIDNLFENVYVHSNATKFVVNIDKDETGNFIEINFYDNGKESKISKGVGLNTVNRNIKRYLGEFFITDNHTHNEFKIHAKIKLINLSKI